jgi:Tfp pilus assembly protein PilP
MRRLAREFANSLAVLAIGLSFGATVWAQGKIIKKPARKAHPAVTAKPFRKPTPKQKPKPAAKPTPPPMAGVPAPAPAAPKPINLAGKRDPFVALVNTAKGPAEHLPPGIAGLVIGTLTVQGTVQGANGMIAVIANPDQRVYFVREGDRLYDGQVEKITLDSVTFQQDTKDAFGKPIVRTVVRRIYPSAGEQQ